jgi:hypothetical protein
MIMSYLRIGADPLDSLDCSTVARDALTAARCGGCCAARCGGGGLQQNLQKLLKQTTEHESSSIFINGD